MKKQKRYLLLWILVISAMISMTAFAGVWKTDEGKNQNQWWYDNEDGTHAQNGWYWLDGNQDGVSECYYFNESGWLTTDSTTPAGYQVNGQTVVFELNESQAAKMLYEQLPMTIEVENFSNNEKIFYPEKELDTTGAPYAAGGAGRLAYYAPWKNVVMFYGNFRSNNDLYQLGQAVAGSETIGRMTGTLQISRVDEPNEDEKTMK